MITEKPIDILDETFDVIAHGCNCFHTMGAGVAKTLKAKYPKVFEVDCNSSTLGSEAKLGTYTVAEVEEGKFIYNLYTQFRYGREKRHLNYEALVNSLELMNISIGVKFGGKPVKLVLPKIGCGLAGGNWNIVLKIIEETIDPKHDIVIALGKAQ